jgi:hypothetical protein
MGRGLHEVAAVISREVVVTRIAVEVGHVGLVAVGRPARRQSLGIERQRARRIDRVDAVLHIDTVECHEQPALAVAAYAREEAHPGRDIDEDAVEFGAREDRAEALDERAIPAPARPDRADDVDALALAALILCARCLREVARSAGEPRHADRRVRPVAGGQLGLEVDRFFTH